MGKYTCSMQAEQAGGTSEPELDMCGDITIDAHGQRLRQAQVLRHVVDEAVISDDEPSWSLSSAPIPLPTIDPDHLLPFLSSPRAIEYPHADERIFDLSDQRSALTERNGDDGNADGGITPLRDHDPSSEDVAHLVTFPFTVRRK
jgi:hypothetical protein